MIQNKTLLAAFFITLLIAQHASAEDTNELPTFIPVRFSDAALAELSKDKTSVSVIASKPKTETRSRIVPVQRMRSETRTRLVDVDGKPTTQTYEVKVPFTEQVEQTYRVTVPGQQVSEPVTVPLNQLEGWDINGVKLTAKSLEEKLSKPTAALVLQRPWPEGAQIEPSHHALLRSDVVMMYSPVLRPARNVIPAMPLVRPAVIRARNP